MQRLNKIENEANIFIKNYDYKRCIWEKQIPEENKKMQLEKRQMKERYNQIITRFMRLSLDVLLYYGVFENIRRTLLNTNAGEKELFDKYLVLREKCAEQLVKPARGKRKIFIEKMNDRMFCSGDIEKLEEHLKSQQEIIRESWSAE